LHALDGLPKHRKLFFLHHALLLSTGKVKKVKVPFYSVLPDFLKDTAVERYPGYPSLSFS
jgi:hypothetical protein